MVSLNTKLQPLTLEMLEEGTGNEMQTTCHAVQKPNTRNAGTASVCSFPDALPVSYLAVCSHCLSLCLCLLL